MQNFLYHKQPKIKALLYKLSFEIDFVTANSTGRATDLSVRCIQNDARAY